MLKAYGAFIPAVLVVVLILALVISGLACTKTGKAAAEQDLGSTVGNYIVACPWVVITDNYGRYYTKSVPVVKEGCTTILHGLRTWQRNGDPCYEVVRNAVICGDFRIHDN